MSKRRCLRSASRRPPPRGGLDLDILSQCCIYLPLADVHSVSLACTEWNAHIRQSATIWEGLLVQKYPSHGVLPEGWCPSGREEYVRRANLRRCQFAPARSLGGLPIPLQRRVPGAELLERWRPDAIVILVDVFTGRHHFDDDLPRHECDPVEERKPLLQQVNLLSCGTRVPSTFFASDECRTTLQQRIPSAWDNAIGAIENFHDAAKETDCLSDLPGLYVEMSYFIEGANVPRCEPITLLSENHSFFAAHDESGTRYRTDIEPCWMIGGRDWDKAETVFEKGDALQRARILSRHIAKYASVPLPFDPQVELWLSPPGERSIDEYWVDDFDVKDQCSIRVESGFSVGEDYDCDFANLVVPELLSLWNDAAKRKKMAAFDSW